MKRTSLSARSSDNGDINARRRYCGSSSIAIAGSGPPGTVAAGVERYAG